VNRRVRIDRLLVDRGLVESREKATRLILAGDVLVDGQRVDKAGALVPADGDVEIRGRSPFVSRGGEKLVHALDHFRTQVAGRICIDVGASTGGFTDCLLQRGAARVAAVDVAYGQLDVRMRQDPRVHVIERLNARELMPADLPFAPSLATIDVSFISLTKVLPAVARCLAPGGEVVRDAADRREAIVKVAGAARELGLPVRGFASSGLPGPKGNRETFVWCGGSGPEVDDLEAAVAAVEGDG
jgi:23S rRNA (cytidine1920-2'-O)/16S rRNA (cytidine1409-2'-O)-methyltransferase